MARNLTKAVGKRYLSAFYGLPAPRSPPLSPPFSPTTSCAPHLGGALEARRIPDGGHIVVCGLGNVGYRVVEELLSQGENVVVIDRQRDNAFLATARGQGVPVIIGDATVPEVLKQARAGTARAIIAATSKELLNLEIGLLVREINPKQRVVLLLVDPQLAQTVREAAEIRLAVSIPSLAAPAFVAALLGDRVRSVFLVAGKLLAVVDLTVSPGDSSLEDKPLQTLAAEYDLLPLRWCASDGRVKTPPADTQLASGDRLAVIIGLVICKDCCAAKADVLDLRRNNLTIVGSGHKPEAPAKGGVSLRWRFRLVC